MKHGKFALAIALLAAAAALFALKGPGAPDGAALEVRGGNKYGLYLASIRAELANDIFGLGDIYPAAVRENGDDFLGKSFVIKALDGDADGARADAVADALKNPGGTLPAIYLAYGDFMKKDYAAAHERLDSLGSKSDAFIVKFFKSWTLVALGRYETALDLLESEINNRAFEKIVLVHLALVAELAGDKEYADELCAEILRFKPDLSDIEDIAGFYIRAGRRDKAIRVVSGFVQDVPSSVSALSLLDAVKDGYVPPAVDTADKGLAKAFFDISNVLMRAFSFTNDLYIMYTGMALDLWPEFDMAKLMKAEAYRKYGRGAEYAAALLAIPKESYLYMVSRLNYANYLMNEGGDPRRALKIYRGLLAGNPSAPAPYQGLGDYYRTSGSPERALGYYSDGIARAGGKSLADLHFARAMAYDSLGKRELAAADFESALELDSKNPVVLNYYGYFLVSGGGDVAKGRKLVESALFVDPMNAYYLDSYAWALFKGGDIPGALRMSEYAKSFEPKNPVIIDHLGDIYWSAGRRREAVFEWKKALAELPGAGKSRDLEGLSEHRLGYKILYGLEE